MSDDARTVAVVAVTDDNRASLVRVVLSSYLGESCRWCGRVYATLDDLDDVVWAGLHANGRLGCGACWSSLTEVERDGVRAECRRGRR